MKSSTITELEGIIKEIIGKTKKYLSSFEQTRNFRFTSKEDNIDKTHRSYRELTGELIGIAERADATASSLASLTCSADRSMNVQSLALFSQTLEAYFVWKKALNSFIQSNDAIFADGGRDFKYSALIAYARSFLNETETLALLLKNNQIMEDKKMALPIAVQLYSVRRDVEKDLRATLEQLKKLGYEGVEFAGLYGNSPEDVKKMCEEVGLIPISAHVTYRDMVADPEGVLSEYATIGCKFVVVPYLIPEDRPGTDGFADVIKNVKILGEVANKLGMTLLYHNHDFEFIKIDGKYALDILYDEVPAELLQTELDTCWVNVGGESPVDYLKKYSGRAPVVHLKDFYGERSEDMYELIGIEKKAAARPSNFEFRPVGSGIQDFPAIIAAAKEAGAEWIVVEQDQPSMGLTPMECVAKSIEYLKSIGY